MTILGQQVGDSTGHELASGTGDGTWVCLAGAEVSLVPEAAVDFAGPELPTGWSAKPYVDGGGATVDAAGLALSGATVGAEALVLGNRSLEFEATFAARPDQDVGFGVDMVSVPWVTFGTKWGRALYARTHFVVSEDKRLRGDWLGAPHRFRIAWGVLDVVFEIDGDRVAKLLVPMPPMMRPLATNRRAAGAPLRVGWMRMSPYAPRGGFTSRVLDAGAPVRWTQASWSATVPEATALQVAVRTGASPTPDSKWTAWLPLAGPGAPIHTPESQFLQYRATMATDDPAVTPVLRSFTATYGR